MPSIVVALIASAAFTTGWFLNRWFQKRSFQRRWRLPANPGLLAPPEETSSQSRGGHRSAVERALSLLPLGVIIVDAAGQDVFRNEVAAAFKTARHGDALVEAAIDEVIEAATSGQPVQRNVDLWGPPLRSLELSGVPIIEAGSCIGATITIEDRSKENEVLQARKDLVDNVSHELRTPVGAMVALSETLENVEDETVQKRLIGRLKDQALRLSEIVNDLLVLSEVESSDGSGFEIIDLGPILAEVLELSSDAAEARGVSLIGLNHAASPVLVNGDRRQLMSVVSNLCDNAIKYSPAGSRVVLSIDADEHTALVTVKDTGVGVPESEVHRIFERFYRVDSARSRETGGTGLGLSIVRNALKVHGGTISLRSVEGRGSTFVARLPLAVEAAPMVLRSADSGETNANS